MVQRHITESMITAKTSTYLFVFLRSICFSPPSSLPFSTFIRTTLHYLLLSFSPFPLLSLSGVSEQTIEMRLSFIIAVVRRCSGRGRDETANVIDEVDLCLI